MRAGPLLLLCLLLSAACSEAPRPTAAEPYQLGGRWYYPREDFSYAATGLAAVLPDREAGRRTANGETHDPAALMAAHRTLQLPAILRVTNLETGRSIRVRLNDRGPADPGREVALSRRAAELLGIPPGGTAQVRIAVEQEASRALAAAAPRPPEAVTLPIATAPRPRLEGESLAPPPGARAAAAAARPPTA
ncbi:MAG: RlpA-like double-psi beta-barrel domain-containing protein, partial [Acetobacteraceae bacterium]|nr:RlpA-like double-psi beta-barrel domain-containing protein [Acetobacteraceae bacterium]